MEAAISRAMQLRTQLQIYKIKIEFNDIINIAHLLNYSVQSYREAQGFIVKNRLKTYSDEHDAFSTDINGHCSIYFKDTLTYNQKIVAIAHEIGHAFCHHHSYNGILGKSEHGETENEQELEANLFATAFLAPPCILHMVGITSTKDIEHITGLSGKYVQNAVVMVSDYSNARLTEQESELCRCYAELYLPPIAEKDNNKSPKISKRFYVILALIASLLVCGTILITAIYTQSDTDLYSSPYTSEFETNASSNNNIVYITENGTKYHTESCYHIKGSDTEKTTREEAEKLGFEACKDCMP